MKDRIVAAYIKDFRDQFGLTELHDSEIYERLVNYCIISKHHPDAFDPEDVTVGGNGDLGLDGVGILVNDHLVFEPGSVDYLKKQLRRLDAEFVFIQSKMSGHFDGAEIGNFISGVRQFFEKDLPQTANESVQEMHKLKEHIFDASIDMDRSPACRLYYVTTGAWQEDSHLKSRIEQGLADLRKTDLFSSVDFFAIDSEGLRRAYRELHNKFVREFVFEKHTILPTIQGVQEAYIGAVPCLEYLKLLNDDEGVLNRRLFYDNVRDFQGHNPVNTEIKETITDATTNDRFALLNNGVTVVARSVNKVGATFRLSDYQIVNGCQTSHILYLNREFLNEKVFLPLKLIVTDDSDVTNKIIQGTNRQTEVKLEALESLAPFQKRLEELYLALGGDRSKALYYERRSKQYDHLELGRDRIVTLPTQINCFVAMFLNEPHSTHRYYGELLSSYRTRLFSETHLPISYFTAATALTAIERLFAKNRLNRQWRALRYQMLMVFRIQNGGAELPPLNSKSIEEYCDTLLKTLNDDTALESAFQKAGETVQRVIKELAPWREPPQRTRAFTTALIETSARRENRNPATELVPGEVVWFSDVKGYGFIAGEDGTEAFIHQSVLVAHGGQTLLTGQKIKFAAVRTSKGLKVVHVAYD